jgi:hypothetical protein
MKKIFVSHTFLSHSIVNKKLPTAHIVIKQLFLYATGPTEYSFLPFQLHQRRQSYNRLTTFNVKFLQGVPPIEVFRASNETEVGWYAFATEKLMSKTRDWL